MIWMDTDNGSRYCRNDKCDEGEQLAVIDNKEGVYDAAVFLVNIFPKYSKSLDDWTFGDDDSLLFLAQKGEEVELTTHNGWIIMKDDLKSKAQAIRWCENKISWIKDKENVIYSLVQSFNRKHLDVFEQIDQEKL